MGAALGARLSAPPSETARDFAERWGVPIDCEELTYLAGASMTAGRRLEALARGFYKGFAALLEQHAAEREEALRKPIPGTSRSFHELVEAERHAAQGGASAQPVPERASERRPRKARDLAAEQAIVDRRLAAGMMQERPAEEHEQADAALHFASLRLTSLARAVDQAITQHEASAAELRTCLAEIAAETPETKGTLAPDEAMAAAADAISKWMLASDPRARGVWPEVLKVLEWHGHDLRHLVDPVQSVRAAAKRYERSRNGGAS